MKWIFANCCQTIFLIKIILCFLYNLWVEQKRVRETTESGFIFLKSCTLLAYASCITKYPSNNASILQAFRYVFNLVLRYVKFTFLCLLIKLFLHARDNFILFQRHSITWTFLSFIFEMRTLTMQFPARCRCKLFHFISEILLLRLTLYGQTSVCKSILNPFSFSF